MSETSQRYLGYAAAIASLLQTVYIVNEVVIGGTNSQFEKGQIYVGTLLLLLIGSVLLYQHKKELPYVYSKHSVSLGIGVVLFVSIIFPWSNVKIALLSDGLALMIWAYILRNEKIRKYVVEVYCWGLVGLVFLGLWQVISGTVSSSTILGMAGKKVNDQGVAVLQFNGARILRAYGFLEHPNNFGAYAVSLWLFAQIETVITRKNIFRSVAILGIVISMSRTTALSWILAGGAWWVVVIVGVVWLIRYKDYFFEESSADRIEQFKQWATMYKTFAWEGTGVGNYARYVREYMQVKQGYSVQLIHNTFLLVLSEWGIVRVLTIYATLRKKIDIHSLAFFIIPLPMLLFDHFLYATHSGRLWWFGFIAYWYIKKN
jgi:hypothetical protein